MNLEAVKTLFQPKNCTQINWNFRFLKHYASLLHPILIFQSVFLSISLHFVMQITFSNQYQTISRGENAAI